MRILTNIRPNDYWMDTVLHELGHAVYSKYLGADLPYLLRTDAHTLTTEAIAMMFGRLTQAGAVAASGFGIGSSRG